MTQSVDWKSEHVYLQIKKMTLNKTILGENSQHTTLENF